MEEVFEEGVCRYGRWRERKEKRRMSYEVTALGLRVGRRTLGVMWKAGED